MSFLATKSGVSGEDVLGLMLTTIGHRFGSPAGQHQDLHRGRRGSRHRFGLVNRLPVNIEWLSDNGSCYVAGEARRFARDISLEPRTTPIESPQSNGMPKPSS